MPSVRPTVCKAQETSAKRRVCEIQEAEFPLSEACRGPAISEAIAKAKGTANEL